MRPRELESASSAPSEGDGVMRTRSEWPCAEASTALVLTPIHRSSIVRCDMATIDITVNGEGYRVDVPDHFTLLDLLRDRLELTGTKDGCSEGVCGACSVRVDGRLVRACLTLARRVDGREVTTVEGLDASGALSRVQQAFVDHGAIQCGFCTPGMLMAISALLDAHPDPSEHEL